jgi:hypothetical protein
VHILNIGPMPSVTRPGTYRLIAKNASAIFQNISCSYKTAMSYSPIDIPPPSEIEATFRAIIRSLYEADDLDNLTVKRIRAAAEDQLDLPAGFLRDNAEWKERSKKYIEAQAAAYEEADKPQSSIESTSARNDLESPRGKKRTQPAIKQQTRKKQKVRSSPAVVEDVTTKEKTAPPRRPTKRGSKRVIDSDEDSREDELDGNGAAGAVEDKTVPNKDDTGGSQSGSDMSELIDEPPKSRNGSKNAAGSKSKSTKIKDDLSESDLSSLTEEPPKPKKGSNKTANKPKAANSANSKPSKAAPNEDLSESEMSELIDAPPTKKRRKKSPGLKSNPSKPKATKSTNIDDPQETEIKRLQGWLIKCGIRKLWHRELASCSNSREKISHLKEMLKDAGMDGRYSVEKAKQIKERRELEADLEAVNEYATKWGTEERGGGGGRPRRAVNVMADLGFGSEDDGVETD